MGLFKRAVFQFKDTTRHTWTESLYYATTNAELGTVRTDAAKLLALRMKMMGIGIDIQNTYVSDDSVARDSLLVKQPKPASIDPTTWNKDLIEGVAKNDTADFPWTTLLFRCESGNVTTKSSFISGVPDGLVYTPNGSALGNGAFFEAFDKWKKELILKWGWKGLITDPTVNPQIAIKSVASVLTLATVTTALAHGFQPDDEIKITGAVTRAGRLNGTYKVKEVPSPTSFKITYNDSVDVNNFEYLRNGLAQKRLYGVLPIADVHPRGVTNKKRGGSVGLPRGRR